MYRNPDSYREKMYQMVEDGLVDSDTVITACLKFMSNTEVKEMMEMNEFLLEDEEEDEDGDFDI